MRIDAAPAGGTTPYLGLDYDDRTIDRVLAALAASPADAPFRYVVTPNVDHVVRLHDGRSSGPARDRLWRAYRTAWLVVCDSRVLARLADVLAGVRLPVVPGSDLTPRVIDELLAAGDRVAIVGGTPATRAALAARRPDVTFVQHVPPMGMVRKPEAMAAAAAFVAEARARFTMLAVGTPQQELLALAIHERGDAVGIGLCIGASLDFLSGHQRRAPRWVQRATLEWAYRLIAEPRRMARRYLVTGPRIFAIAWRARRAG